MKQTNKKMRWRYFIDKPFQIRFIARFSFLIILGLVVSLLSMGIFYRQRYSKNLFYQVKNVEEFQEMIKTNPDLPYYVVFDMSRSYNEFQIQMWPMIWLSVLYLVLIAVFGLFISHKMAGPIYRIKKTLDEATEGKIDIKTVEFRLRKQDELHDVVKSLNRFLDKINKS
ncbi:HAMP domain-containing protein [Thermospira aquatica]|uniref:HAMP domain-containing protein n=1 Tax=Thermospira aquatica TaxID=2828656 RepID=A0AAX3BDF4_9SPIR|nr:hypothetical protein [Thermospira aquatica]URA10230.1 hypothetical protein KDW03_00020 [Thermospira aquatica]